MKKVGADLRKVRQAKGLSQQDVADKAGCTKAYVCDIEYGRRALGGDKARAVLKVLEAYLDQQPTQGER